MSMRPRKLISIAVNTPALTTAAMTLLRPIETVLVTGGDVRTYTTRTQTLTSVLMSRNITSHTLLFTATDRWYIQCQRALLTPLRVSCAHSLRFNFTASCYWITTVEVFFFLSFSLFLSFYNSVPEAIEPSLCVPLRGETAVKNILLFMSNFPSSHSPAQIKHATFREKEGKKLWVISSCNRINAGFPLLFDCYSVQVVMTLRWFWTLRLSVSTCSGGKERFAICVGQVELVYFGFSQVEDLLCFCLLDKLEV